MQAQVCRISTNSCFLDIGPQRACLPARQTHTSTFCCNSHNGVKHVPRAVGTQSGERIQGVWEAHRSGGGTGGWGWHSHAGEEPWSPGARGTEVVVCSGSSVSCVQSARGLRDRLGRHEGPLMGAGAPQAVCGRTAS